MAELDPVINAVLTQLQEAGAPPLFSHDPQADRVNLEALLAQAAGEHVHEVATVEDITIGSSVGDLPARKYDPRTGAGTVPTIVFFHGGGWTIGDLDSHDAMARLIAREVHAVVIAVDYRLAPENPFPAAFDDAVAATEWVRADPARGGGGPVAVAGDSAGGNLAAAVATHLAESGVILGGQLLLYPAVDLSRTDRPSFVENAEGYFLTTEGVEIVYDNYAGAADRTDPRISPLFSDAIGRLGPTVIGVGHFDPLRDDAVAFADAVRGAGGQAEVTVFPAQIHAFATFADISEGARAALSELLTAFRQRLARD